MKLKINPVIEFLNEYLDDVILATNQSLEVKNFDYETAVEIIEHFDGLFTDMLDIFTSNTDQLSTLDPYKQTDIGFKRSLHKESEEEDIYDILKLKRSDILGEFGIRTYRMLQRELMLDNEAFVEDWLEKNNFTPSKKPPFEEQIREVIKREIKSLKNSH